MLSKIEKLMEESPRFRRFFYKMDYYSPRTLIICYVFCAVLICVPTIVAFFSLSDSDRLFVSSIIGGSLSLVVIPLLSIYVKHKNKKMDELYDSDRILYDELTSILLQLLADEYLLHDKSLTKSVNKTEVNDKVEEIVSELEGFVNQNYDKMCNRFSSSLILSILDVHEECKRCVTTYINIKERVRRCCRFIRKESGARGLFYIDQRAVEIRCAKSCETVKHIKYSNL